MEYVFWIFVAGMFGLLVYSIVSTSLAIRKKAQPTVDSFCDALYSILFVRKPVPKRDPPDNPARK
jgi:hypothetical protein